MPEDLRITRYDLTALPVVSSEPEGRLLGVITADDIIDVIQEEANEDVAHMSGSDAQELRRGNGSEPDSIDPHLARMEAAMTILRDCYEGLASMAPDGTPMANAMLTALHALGIRLITPRHEASAAHAAAKETCISRLTSDSGEASASKRRPKK